MTSQKKLCSVLICPFRSNLFWKVFSDKPNSFRQFVVRFVAEWTIRFCDREIMVFQLLFLFSFALGLVSHKNASPDKGVFAQRHSYMKLSCLLP